MNIKFLNTVHEVQHNHCNNLWRCHHGEYCIMSSTYLAFLAGAASSAGSSGFCRFFSGVLLAVGCGVSSCVEVDEGMASGVVSFLDSNSLLSCILSCCTRQSIALNTWSASLGLAWWVTIQNQKLQYQIMSVNCNYHNAIQYINLMVIYTFVMMFKTVPFPSNINGWSYFTDTILFY